MKKIAVLALSVLLSFCAAAQKIHFTDAGNQWNILHTADNVYDNYAYISRIGGDTVIHGYGYKIIPDIYTSYASCGSCTSAFIREDTVLNKVFILINDTDRVLMDYTLHTGDTVLHTDATSDTSIYTVSGIDSTLINGVYHKVWAFSLVYPTSLFVYAGNYYVIEGVGCTNGPLFIQDPLYFETIENLTCFYHAGTNPAISPMVSECGSFIFDNQTSCNTGVNAVIKTAPGFNIFPNPVSTSLSVTSTQNITNIIITDLLGQTIYTQSCNTEKVQVDVSQLSSGIYFIKVNTGPAMLTITKKFVKE